MDSYRVRRASKTETQDQYVLTVFLPLLAIAILACAGGCCYMERRKKKKKMKYGGVDLEEANSKEQDFDDAASVISTASSRRRHYLMPTQTTGRLVRGASVRSNYCSNFVEPVYESYKRDNKNQGSMRRRSQSVSNLSRQSQYEQQNDYERRNRSRSTGGYGERPLTRSRSVMDVRYNDDNEPRSMRRTRSSTNLDRYHSSAADSGYQENQSIESGSDNTYEYLNGKSGQPLADSANRNIQYNRAPSPSNSDWSVRTAPPRNGFEDNYKRLASRPSSRPSSMIDFPLPQVAREQNSIGLQRHPSLMRSMSQPDLHSIGSKTCTYPQGILKKGPSSEDGKYPGMQLNQASSNSSDSGIKDIYGDMADVYNGRMSAMSQRHTMPNLREGMGNARPNSRPPSVMSYAGSMTNRQHSYDPYYAARYSNYSNTIQQQQQLNYNEQPIYAISRSGYQQHQPRNASMYAQNYDLYGQYNNSYWQRPQQQQQHHSDIYGRASMY